MIKTVLVLQSVILAALLLLAADLYAHKRIELVGGVNVWGYRGPTVRARVDGDVRILYVGGTRAYGYGTTADGTIPYALEWRLTGWIRKPVTIINAAAMGATAGDYAALVSRYLHLQPDVVMLYDDLGQAATRPARSRFAQWSGYTPALPLVLEEKGALMQQDPAAWKHPVGAIAQASGRLMRTVESPHAPVVPGDYGSLMLTAVERARTAGAVLLVVDPPSSDLTTANLTSLRNALATKNDPRVRLIVLPHVADPEDLLDGYSYGGAARGRVVLAIGPELLALVK